MDFLLKNPLNMLFAVLAAGSALALLWQSFAARGVSRVSNTQASILMSARGQVVDVRDVEAFASGHIKNSKSLPLSQLEQQITLAKLKKDRPVVLVCERGGKASKAASVFVKNGFADVHVLEGGLVGWRAEQLPVVKD